MALLAAVFATHGTSAVLAWDNNQTRGTLGWRTEKGQHDATILDLLPGIQHLLGPDAHSADFDRFVHHQSRDRYDVLRSKPSLLAHEQRFDAGNVDAIHAVAANYYRLMVIDTGNDESGPM
ncbi:MinD/ParA family ATP-binding protein [Rathayibacter sp. CAU 1779]